MNEQELKEILQQILDVQKQLVRTVEEISQRLEKLAPMESDKNIINEKPEQQEPEAIEVWKRVLERAQTCITKPSFETWLKGTEAIQIEDNTIIVLSQNAFARDWLESRYTRIIEEILQSLPTLIQKVRFVSYETTIL